MLDLMRRHARSWLIKVALGGIIIVFVFWYGWSGPGEQTRTYAANVNGTVISNALFYSMYESELAKIRLRFKGSIPSELMDKLNLKEQVIQSLVDQILLLQEAQRLGMLVTEEDLVRDIQSNKAFQRNGVFDVRLYNAYLEAIKLTPALYEDFQRRQLLAMQLVQLLTDGVKADPQEIKRLWHFQNDKLVLFILMIKPETINQKPDTGVLESYFKKNQSTYEIPETVEFKYVVLSWADIAKKLTIDDAEARSYYDTHLKEFTVPERVRARHILLTIPEKADQAKKEEVLKKAKELLARIKGGEKFEEVAKAESQDESSAPKGGDLGFFSRGTMNRDFEKAAFKSEVGLVSEPVLTGRGYHLIKVEEKTPEKQLDFQSVKDKIVKKLAQEKARKMIDGKADDFYEHVYRSEDLEGEAKKADLKVKDSGPVSRNGEIPGVGSNAEVLEEAFQLKTGEISKLLRSGDDYVIMKLVRKNKARMPSLDDVRSLVEKDYLKHEGFERAKQKAEGIIDTLKKDPADYAQAAQQVELKWQELDPVSRTTGLVPRLGRSPQVAEMLTTVSQANPIFPEPISVTDGVVVVRLAEVERADESRYTKEAPQFEKWVLEVRKTDFLKGWVKRLRDKGKIDINRKLL